MKRCYYFFVISFHPWIVLEIFCEEQFLFCQVEVAKPKSQAEPTCQRLELKKLVRRWHNLGLAKAIDVETLTHHVVWIIHSWGKHHTGRRVMVCMFV